MSNIKKIISNVLMFIMVLSTLNFTVSAATQVDARLYVDGSEIVYDYNNAKPLFVDGDAYIPIRSTAGYMGMTFEYNDQTKTMTFSKNGLTSVYTLGQTHITVNNQAIKLSSPAIILNDSTYMSVEMFGAAVNSEVAQDFNMRSIHIYSNPIITAAPTASKPVVLTVNADKYVQEYREYINISVTASSTTKSLRLVDYNNQVVAQSTDYVTKGNTNIFYLKYAPDVNFSEEKTYYLYPGDGSSYYTENAKNIIFKDTLYLGDGSSTANNNIYSVSASNRYLDYGETATIYVYTNSNIQRVRLDNSYDSSILTSTNYTTTTNGRLFTFNVTKYNNSNVTYSAYAGSLTAYSTYPTTIVIYDDSNYNNNNNYDSYYDNYYSGYGDIYNISVNNRTVTTGQYTNVVIQTNANVKYIEIKDYNQNVLYTINSGTYNQGYGRYDWGRNVQVTSDSANVFYVYAYDDYTGNSYDRASFTVYGSNYSNNNSSSSSSYAIIHDLYPMNESVYVGSNADIRIRTNRDVDYIEIRDNKNNVVATLYTVNQYIDTNTSMWKADVEIESFGNNDYTAHAYDFRGYQTTANLTVVGI